ncbi:MAG: ATP-dependent Clp protease ATP-binding subunit [Cellvibrionales bacterium]|jgi:ATP-dependent Clp protease ATP-binding subunit ClpC|nr:ATP-dependent Clp protease ATP-binding subunit [Cellvibrionales bacterium]
MSQGPNFSPKSQYFITKSKELAFSLGHLSVREEHLLILLLESEDDFIDLFLRKQKISKNEFVSFVTTFGSLNKKGESDLSLTDVAYNDDFKTALNEAHKLSEKCQDHYIGAEHLFFALLNRKGGVGCMFLTSIDKEPNKVMLDFLNLLKFKNLTFDIPGNQGNPGSFPKTPTEIPSNTEGSSLENFCVNLNEMSSKGKIDKVIGRDSEVNRIFQILGRKNKNNPILIGDPGVGKTACVEGLASLIMAKRCPSFLHNFEVYAVDIASMVAGTKYRGQFEQRLKNLISEVSDCNIILFIDEAHTLIGAGSAEGALDAANILKPALARGQIKLITATTYPEYKKSIEKDMALNRRLEPVFVDEPNKSECLEILNGIKKSYEKFHDVKYSKTCLKKIVDLAEEFLPTKYFPDKAIDLMDEAGSCLKISNLTEPSSLSKIESQLYDLSYEPETDAKLEESLLDRYEDEYKKWEKSIDRTISIDLIESIVAKKTKVPVDHINKSSSFNLNNLKRSLKSQVIGQPSAIDSIVDSIGRSKLGIKDSHKPISSFLFLGLTGTGKTYTGKVLAEKFFGDSKKVVRLDMSEYSEKISSSKLIGSSPGYVGYEEGGFLIEKVKKTPHCVLIFDEIEKAHRDVQQLLLQILEEGEIEDQFGGKAYFKDCVIILTSNIGAHLLTKTSLGFGQSNNTKEEEVRGEAIKLLSPELCNRLDEIILFENLPQESFVKILNGKISSLKKKLKKRDISLSLDQDSAQYICELARKENMGARPLDRIIKKNIESPLSSYVLNKNINTSINFDFYLSNSEIKFKVS